MALAFELVLPCYNEAQSLPALVDRATAAAQRHGLTPESFQLVLVNNGSTDDSAQVLSRLSRNPFCRIVTIAKNKGYGNGILTGLRTTTAPIIGFTHADGQCDPEDAIAALKIVEPGYLVKGRRCGRAWFERALTHCFELCARWILGIRATEINAQPKVFPRELLNRLSHAPDSIAFDVYLLYQAQRRGFQIKEIAVHFPPRMHGMSHWAGSLRGRIRTMAAMLVYLVRLRRTQGAV